MSRAFGMLPAEVPDVEFNRNQWFMVGLLILFVGIQIRVVDSVVLTEESTRILTEKMGTRQQAATSDLIQTASFGTVVPRKVIEPPRWVGWALIAAGVVFVLHSLALRKPG